MISSEILPSQRFQDHLRSLTLFRHNGNLLAAFHWGRGFFTATAFPNSSTFNYPTLTAQISHNTLKGVGHTVPAFEKGVQSHAECTAEHPQDAYGYPSREELLTISTEFWIENGED